MNHDEFLDALAAGEGRYLECPEGHGWLPPRRVCPECGARELSPEPLPDAGEIVALTEVKVASPDFADDAPYLTAVADFGPVRLTGQVRGGNPDDASVGDVVGANVAESVTSGERVVVLRRR